VLTPHVQQAGTLGAEEPLVAVGGGEVDAPGVEVGGEDAEALDGVDAEEGAHVPARPAEGRQVGTPARAVLDPAGGHELRRRAGGHGGGEVGRRHPVDHHAAVPQREPRVGGGGELAGRNDHAVAG
jgi:hypothetical protein